MHLISDALLATHRDARDDLAFSALPAAPRRPDGPGPVRRTLARWAAAGSRRS